MTFAQLSEEDRVFFESWLDKFESETREMQMQEMERKNEQGRSKQGRNGNCRSENVYGSARPTSIEAIAS